MFQEPWLFCWKLTERMISHDSRLSRQSDWEKREKFFLSLLHIFWLNSQSTICNSLRTSKHSVCTSSAVGGWSSFVDMSQDNKANPNAYLQPDGSVAPEDRVKFLLAVEEKSKETLVNISTADILREKVRQCYRKEGMWS